MIRDLFIDRLPPIAEWDIIELTGGPADEDGFREATIRFRYRDKTRPVTQADVDTALHDLLRAIGRTS